MSRWVTCKAPNGHQKLCQGFMVETNRQRGIEAGATVRRHRRVWVPVTRALRAGMKRAWQGLRPVDASTSSMTLNRTILASSSAATMVTCGGTCCTAAQRSGHL